MSEVKIIDGYALWRDIIQSRKETIIDDTVSITIKEFVELLDKAEPVETRKVGHWVHDDKAHWYRCSECNNWMPIVNEKKIPELKGCPFCMTYINSVG
jgi:hypothetical protein